MLEESSTTEPKPAGWRLYVAMALVITSLGSAALIPLVTASDLSAEMKATLSASLVFGIPQVLMVSAVALVGKSGLSYLKGLIFGFFKGFAPARTVGRTRYRLGLVLFVLPLLMGFLGPYLADHLPVLAEQRMIFAATGDVMFLLSFFVLGGDFWDKMRALFVYDARARFPAR